METVGTHQEWFAELPIAALVVLYVVYQGCGGVFFCCI